VGLHSPIPPAPTPLQCNAFYFPTRKSSSRTNCPSPAHPASRIFLCARDTLIHGARRQIKTQNKKQTSPRTSVPPRQPDSCPSPPTLLTSPKMTTNPAPSHRLPLLSHNRSCARKRPCCRAVFLIANARLKFRSSHRKLSPLKFPNRERMTISHRITEPPTTAQGQFLPPMTHSLSTNQPPGRRLTRLRFLIVTPRLEFPLKPANTISSKFLIVTKRTFIIRPAAWDSSPSLNPPNFNLRPRDELRLKWHRHSCLCSDDPQPTTSTHHPRPHFTRASKQPKPSQSNSREQAEAA